MTAPDGVILALVTLIGGDTEVRFGRVVGRHADLGLVDALARLHLAAGRAGCSLRLRAVCPQLTELIELAGLTDLLGDCQQSAREARGQAEAGEQLDVEEGKEVVDGGDLPT